MNLIEEVNRRKLAIFDFDGLMVNSEQVVYLSLKKLFNKYGQILTWDYFARHIGTPVSVSIPQFYKDYPLPLSYDDFLLERNSVIKEAMNTSLKLMPGLIQFLNILKEKQLILSIGTSAKRRYLKTILMKYNIQHYFKYIVTADDVKRGKPYPDIFVEILKKANFKSNEAFILEDSPSGIQAAKAIQIMCVAIPAPKVNIASFSGASFIVDSLETLVQSFNKTS
ncbi:HAD family phosphatase [Candidatus Roizmanbacteria bacterium]|nr:HAD family phosphatase [Candidatus Roizmanbacteria bacterium]